MAMFALLVFNLEVIQHKHYYSFICTYINRVQAPQAALACETFFQMWNNLASQSILSILVAYFLFLWIVCWNF